MRQPADAKPVFATEKSSGFRYLQASVLSFVGYLALTAVGAERVGIAPWLAALIAVALVTKMNFWLMRRYVFPGEHEAWPVQFVKFTASIAWFRLGEYLLFLVGVGLLNVHYTVCQAAILAGSFVLKFVVFRTHIFGRGRSLAAQTAGAC